jgi:DNA-binding LytR/AlgR family response regulator
MIKYIIVDDEYVAHDIIKGYCDFLPNMHLMKNCYDALEAFEYLQKQEVDLIFLDLNMPVLKGFEFLKTQKIKSKVIVTTAYKEFALEGYEHNISDYLLKPFGFERFLKAINNAFSTSAVKTVVTSDSNTTPNTIFLQNNKKYIQVVIDHILYLESTGNYTKIVLITETITIREKLSSLLSILPKNNFVQAHKSFAIAPKHIKSIEGNRILIANYIIPIGNMFKKNVVELLQ